MKMFVEKNCLQLYDFPRFEDRKECAEQVKFLLDEHRYPDWAPRTVHPRTVPNRTEHLQAESPPRSEFSSASRTESRGECTARYDSVRIAHSVGIYTKTPR